MTWAIGSIVVAIAPRMVAQSNYASPYQVSTIAGNPALSFSVNGTGTSAGFGFPSGIAVDSNGNLYVADAYDYTVRAITPNGLVTTLAGTPSLAGTANGTGLTAQFEGPWGIAVDGSGNIYVADHFGQTIRKITTGGVVTTLAGSPLAQGSSDGVGSAARFKGPAGLAVDTSGNVYVADSGNNTIRKITPSGVVTTVAGQAGTKGSSNGAAASALFNTPYGVAVDRLGNIYVADSSNFTIREITPGGIVSTVAGMPGAQGSTDGTGGAARFAVPWGIAVDGAGNLYVADAGNDTIRKITSGGTVTTLAGVAGKSGTSDGVGPSAQFNFPYDVIVDATGNLFIADSGNNEIRKAQVAISAVPGIVVQPTSTSVVQGATATFSVQAYGTPSPTYQ